MGGVVLNRPAIRILGASAVAVPLTGGTSETTLATISVPAGAMGANGILQIRTLWSMTNNANNKTCRVRFSGAAGTQFIAAVLPSAASAQNLCIIQNRNSQSSQVGHTSGTFNTFNFNTGAITTASVDTSAATTIVISGQLASAADTVTLESYHVELILP
jgi:hypothetical protein